MQRRQQPDQYRGDARTITHGAGNKTSGVRILSRAIRARSDELWRDERQSVIPLPRADRLVTERVRDIFSGGSNMARVPFIGALVPLLVAFQIVPTGHVRAEALTEIACVDVPRGEKRPEFGCFNVGVVTGLHFSEASVYWHLRAFPSRSAAEAAKSTTGIVVEEDGRAWLSEFSPRITAALGGETIAVVGPLQLPAAKSYAAVLSYAVMRPGDSSRVHAHPGPEGWYVLSGEQCLETPAGANKARAGGTMNGAAEHSNGIECHGYDAPARVCPRHP
jgi:hypothetical protein